MIKVKLCLLFLLGISMSCSPLNTALKSKSINKKYEYALQFYKNEQYDKAIVIFNEILPLLSGDKRGESAYFYHAYCHYYTKQYLIASNLFGSFYRTYKRSQYAEEALFMETFTLYESSPVYSLDQSLTLDNIDKIQSFINLYPENKLSEKANQIINELLEKIEKKYYYIAVQYEKIRQYKSALVAYSNYIKDYPNSRYKEEAYFRQLKVQYKLASLSLDHLKEERYEEAVDLYHKFIDRYAKSTYIKEAELIYRNTLTDLKKLLQQNKAKKLESLNALK